MRLFRARRQTVHNRGKEVITASVIGSLLQDASNSEEIDSVVLLLMSILQADTHLGASTVHRLWRRWLEQGNVAIYRNVGATRVTSARVDRRILRQAVAAPQATCTAILQHVKDTLDHSISTRTISRRLVANGLHSCRPLRRLPLTPPNRRQRLEWCRARSTWMTEWHRVVFSDESRFCLSSDSRRVRVWRRRGERFNPQQLWNAPPCDNVESWFGAQSRVLDRLRFLPIKKMDQRTCIKFCVKNEIKCADAFRMLTVAYGEATLDRSNVYRWYKMFSEGREDVNDEERAGRPSTSTTDEKINEVEKMILANRRITVREVAEDLNISIGSCHSIFINDLGITRVAAKFVTKLLNCDQKQHRMNIANEMLDSVRDDLNLLQRVITGDEAWVYGYDVETKAQSSQWKLPHEPRPKKARQVRSNVKVLLTVFFGCRGVVHHEFLPQGRTVNKEYYLQVMRNLREAICQKRRDLWKNKNWLLHHDNASAHTSLLVRDFLAKTTH
ncbi:hypothetical protein LAZ67_17000982 [Cordylochernes scorpioides]|uniref:Transposase n=1 Tax=Cordylochernes scorpioides TaxID=51811 RepID=A0ABY6LFN2_9ARAC|nr:hypothetical protein LAZ67_17000982 [Cordylochernes scorpioides]